MKCAARSTENARRQGRSTCSGSRRRSDRGVEGPAQLEDLVANLRRLLELEVAGVGVHPPLELADAARSLLGTDHLGWRRRAVASPALAGLRPAARGAAGSVKSVDHLPHSLLDPARGDAV